MALWGGRFTQAADQRFINSMICLRFGAVCGGAGYCRFCGTVQSVLVTLGVLTADEQRQLEEALNVLLEEGSRESQQILQSVRKISIAGWKVRSSLKWVSWVSAAHRAAQP